MYTAPGVRGLRPHHIKCLATSEAPICKKALKGILKMGEQHINMTLPKIFRIWLSAGLVITLNKSAAGIEQRPIKMEDYDIQLWYKNEAHLAKSNVAKTCAPEQLGIGVSAGVKTMVLGRQLEMDLSRGRRNGTTLAKFDIYNAFQEYSRVSLKEIVKGLEEENINNEGFKRLRKVVHSLIEINAPIYMNGENGLEKYANAEMDNLRVVL
jgi:hypothetical protein